MVRFGSGLSTLQLFLAEGAHKPFLIRFSLLILFCIPEYLRAQGYAVGQTRRMRVSVRSAPDFEGGTCKLCRMKQGKAFPPTLCFVLSTGGSGTYTLEHIWKHLNKQLRQQKGEMASLQNTRGEDYFPQIAIGCEASLNSRLLKHVCIFLRDELTVNLSCRASHGLENQALEWKQSLKPNRFSHLSCWANIWM